MSQGGMDRDDGRRCVRQACMLTTICNFIFLPPLRLPFYFFVSVLLLFGSTSAHFLDLHHIHICICFSAILVPCRFLLRINCISFHPEIHLCITYWLGLSWSLLKYTLTPRGCVRYDLKYFPTIHLRRPLLLYPTFRKQTAFTSQ